MNINPVNTLLSNPKFIRFWEERAIFDTSYLAHAQNDEYEINSYSIELIEGKETLGINFTVSRLTGVDSPPKMAITGLFGWNKGITMTRPIEALLVIMNSHYEMEMLKETGLGKEIL